VDGTAKTQEITISDTDIQQITDGKFAATFVPDDPTEFRPTDASVGRANLPKALLEVKARRPRGPRQYRPPAGRSVHLPAVHAQR